MGWANSPQRTGGGGMSSGSAAGTGDNIQTQSAASSDNGDYDVIVERGPRTSGSHEPYVGPATYDNATRSATQLLNEWRHADSARVAALQQQMVAANILAPKGYTPGIWDELTEAAYLRTMWRAHLHDKTPAEILAEAGKAAAGAGEAGAENPALTISLTNPEDIMKAAKDQAKNILGRKLTDKQAQEFVAIYQGIESANQRTAYSQQYGAPGHAGPGGTTTQAPSLSSFTEDQIRQRFPTEAGSHDIAQAGSDFFSMLRGG